MPMPASDRRCHSRYYSIDHSTFKSIMKQLLFSIAMTVCLGLGVHAQEQTLFGNARVVGGFGGPIVEIGLGNDLNTSVGGGGGLVINSFFLGGYGMGSFDFSTLVDEDAELEGLELGHGGIWLGFSVPSRKLVHFYGSARVGWGALDINFRDSNFDDLDNVFVMTPEVGLELNLTRWFRLAATAGYRFVDGANTDLGYTNDDFSGAMAGITLRFGGFGSHRW